MKSKIYTSCTSCPAALVCRSANVHYTHICPKCGRPWILLLPDVQSSYVYAVILHRKNCDDENLQWETRADCPTCSGWDGSVPWEHDGKRAHVLDVDLSS